MTTVLLEFNHGLGDAAQFSVVLQHLRRYRPDWTVDVFAKIGKHSAMTGLCHRAYHDKGPRPDKAEYDQYFDLHWWENYSGFHNAPQTKNTNCLMEVFGIEPDLELYRYKINVSPEAWHTAAAYLLSVSGRQRDNGRFPAVLIHYEGNTSADKKNLRHEQIQYLCELIIGSGYTPVILDWDRRSPLPNGETIFCPGVGDGDIWGNTGTGDAEILTALIQQSALMIGVDSGPLHCAGATDTPTLGVWTGHHPMQFYDLCPNVTHLVPGKWRGMSPCTNNPASIEFFTRHYRYVEYENVLKCLVLELRDRLGAEETVNGKLVESNGFWVRRDNIEQDLVIVRDVFQGDAYRTTLQRGRFEAAEVVLDVGAHIGCFAKLAHRYNPKAKIVCVEACPENIEALKANVGGFAEIVHAACTYEASDVALLNAVRPNCESTGGSVVVPAEKLANQPNAQPGYTYWNDTRPLPKVTLEDLMQRFGFDTIDVLKLDCESSEYSILGKTPSLHKVRFVCGEYHGATRWNKFRAQRFAGWDYGHMHDGGESGGLFHLVNPSPGRRPLIAPPLLRVAVPSGIGDAIWALMKVPALIKEYGAKQAHVTICGGGPPRSKQFVEMLDFVAAAEYSDLSILEQHWTTAAGHYNYAPSQPGWHGRFDWLLQANGHLEQGKRLEDWLPELETEWEIVGRLRFRGSDLYAARQARALAGGSYGVLYLGPLEGNTTAGHNRGSLWSTDDWSALSHALRDAGKRIVVVGAEWDRPYFERCSGLAHDVLLIGRTSIGNCLSIISQAEFFIGYQSGLGIMAHYFGVPTAMFWRPFGDSIRNDGFVSFQESMATAWNIPDTPRERFLPCYYGRTTPGEISDWALEAR